MHLLGRSSADNGGGNPVVAQMIRFGLVGLCATGTYFVSTLLLHRYVPLSLPVAAAVSFAVVVAMNYVAHYSWTFRSDRAHAAAIPRFLATSVGGLAINTVVVALGGRWPGARQTTILLVGAVVVMIWNYLLSRFWVFIGRRVAG